LHDRKERVDCLIQNYRTKAGVVSVLFLISVYMILSCGKDPVSTQNNNPVITSLLASKTVVNQGDSVSVIAVYSDIDGDSLITSWKASGGLLTTVNTGSATWKAPNTSGEYAIIFSVDDRKGGTDKDSVVITISNQVPVITGLNISSSQIFIGRTVSVLCTASDPDGHPLSYSWEVSHGKITGSSSGDSIAWTAPESPNSDVQIKVTVTDIQGGTATKTLMVNVYAELGVLWVADTFNDRVVKLSVTGSILIEKTGFKRPLSLAVNPDTREVWVADTDNNRVVRMGPNGTVLAEVKGLVSPQAIDVYAFDGKAWVVLDTDSNQVIQISRSTDSTRVLRKITGFRSPRAISVDQDNGDVWIADTGNDRIIRLDAGNPDFPDTLNVSTAVEQYFRIFDGFRRPSALDVYAREHYCWVADELNSRIVRLDRLGREIEITGFLSPSDIMVNSRNSAVWIADPELEKVIKIYHDIEIPPPYHIGRDKGSHIEVSNFSQPLAVTVNDISENESEWTAWFAEELRLVKVDNRGNIITSISGFNAPRSIKINEGH